MLSAVLLTVFVLVERRSAEPLVRLDIFRVRTIRAARVVVLFVASGIFAMFFFNRNFPKDTETSSHSGRPGQGLHVPPKYPALRFYRLGTSTD